MSDHLRLRIFLSASDLSAGATIVRLPHPRTGTPFAVALAGSQKLLEVQKFQEPPADHPRSWLLAGATERVQQDGTLFVATPLDPLFLLLPPLRALRGGASEIRRESSAGLFRPMSELSGEGEEEQAALEATALALPDLLTRLRAVCDVNDKYDEPMVRLNDEKLSAWLMRKVNALKAHLASDASAAKLAAQRVADSHASQFDDEGASAFGGGGGANPAVNNNNTAAADPTLVSAVCLVAEYLDAPTASTLCSACGVAMAAVEAQRGPEKRGGALSQPPPLVVSGSSMSSSSGSGPPSAGGSSWATDLADADAEVSAQAGVKRPAMGGGGSQNSEPQKKAKPAAPAKSKAAAIPLKKGQKTMMGFFAKPK